MINPFDYFFLGFISGENLQQTLHRLGIDLPQNVINQRNF